MTCTFEALEQTQHNHKQAPGIRSHVSLCMHTSSLESRPREKGKGGLVSTVCACAVYPQDSWGSINLPAYLLHVIFVFYRDMSIIIVKCVQLQIKQL